MLIRKINCESLFLIKASLLKGEIFVIVIMLLLISARGKIHKKRTRGSL